MSQNAPIQVARSGKHISIFWCYGPKNRDVSERAFVQCLHEIFHVSRSQIESLTWCGSFIRRNWKPLKKRTKAEQTGAFMVAFWWLLAMKDTRDGAEFWAKAAPWAPVVYSAIGNEAWGRCCELLEISAHEQTELLLTPPIAHFPANAPASLRLQFEEGAR